MTINWSHAHGAGPAMSRSDSKPCCAQNPAGASQQNQSPHYSGASPQDTPTPPPVLALLRPVGPHQRPHVPVPSAQARVPALPPRCCGGCLQQPWSPRLAGRLVRVCPSVCPWPLLAGVQPEGRLGTFVGLCCIRHVKGFTGRCWDCVPPPRIPVQHPRSHEEPPPQTHLNAGRVS